MTLAVLGLLLLGLAIGWPLTAALVRIGHRAGALDTHGGPGHAKELRPVPNIGGIAIFTSIALPMLIGLAWIGLAGDAWIGEIVPELGAHVERVRETMPTALAMLAALAALHVLGLIDDRRGLGAPIKLVVQFAAAGAMVLWFDVRLLTALDGWFGGGQIASIIVSILWIVLITNAVNFLDNMDGLAGGVCAIAGAFFLIATILNAQWFIAATLGLMIGGLIGFLFFNFPRKDGGARIFMGDGGSLVLGFLLAILTMRTTYYDPAQESYVLGGGWYAVFMPVIVLAIPLYDFFTVTAIRVSQGSSPFVGDQQHFSHRLVERGMTKRGAVLVIWAATAVTGVGGVSLGSLEAWQAALVGVQTLLVLGMLAIIEHASRHARNGRAG